jgi:phosphonoacetaldehyde hydrolase
MEVVTPLATQQGYTPDCLVTGDFKPKGRPAPFMIFENLRQLDVYPLSAVIKIGDTVPDIEEGLNAGVWSVAVVDSSNEIGMSYEAWSDLDEVQKEKLRIPVREKFHRAGAHFVISSLEELSDLIEEVEFLIFEGKTP